MARYRISVIIDSYNSSQFIGRAIESVLCQTRTADEVIVSDASTDNSREIIRQFAARDPLVKPIFAHNRGQVSTIFAGLAGATGDLVFLLDGDDQYAPEHLDDLETRWFEFPRADLIYCRHRLFGDPLLVDFLRNTDRHECADWLGPISLEEPYDYARSAALAWCHPNYHAGGITSALSFRRSHLQSLPLEELIKETHGQLRANADYMLLLASALYGGCKVYVPNQTVEHRIHATSMTGRHAAGDRESLTDQRRYCAIARSWLRSRPGFGADFFKVLTSEMSAVPNISTGHRRLYAEAERADPDNKAVVKRLLTTKRRLLTTRSQMLDTTQRLATSRALAEERLKQIRALETSTFWQMSAPLRFCLDKVRSARKRLFRPASERLRFKAGTVAIDVSTIWHHDAGTGIQRVVRKLAVQLATVARDSKRVVLVDYSTGVPLDITQAFLSRNAATTSPTPVTDLEMLIMLDSSYNLAPSFSRRLREAKRDGVLVISICHDLLPVTNPEWFLAVNHLPFRRWLDLATNYSSAFLCVSETTANRLRKHLAAKQIASPPAVASWPLGHDLDTWAAPSAADSGDRQAFALMVGTVEPRKNHVFVLETLARMRDAGAQIPRLVVVGRYGWKNNAAKRLLREAVSAGWAEWQGHGVPDADLSDLYARARCVIQASLDEGFGLPVAEASAMGKPVVLSDIPVFREIVQENGYFFRLGDTKSFGDALASAYQPGAKPTTTKTVSWRESADIFWQHCLELRKATY